MSRLVAAPHPFKTETIDRIVPEGLTLAEMLEHAQCDPVLRAHAHIWIADQYIPRHLWHRVRPKPGVTITLRVVPHGGGGGGGKNPLRTVLTIAVVAAAFAFGPALGGVLASTFGAAGATASTAIFGSFTFGTLGGALIAIGGTLLVNAIAPIRPPSLPSLSGTSTTRDSPTLFIEGARNSARPFGTVPVVLGVHKNVPPLGVQTYTEVVGDDNYLRMLVVWGYGPLKVEDIKIGETPIGDFDGVQIETREGRAGDAAITLIPDTVAQDDFSILLAQASDWQTRSAQPNADELSVDITFPQGLVQFDAQGQRGSASVAVQIQYREVAGGSPNPWLTPTFTAKTVADSWVSGDTITFSHNRTSVVRHGFRWAVAPRGNYEVRIRRTTADTSGTQIFDTCSWTAMRAITDEDPIAFAHPLAVTALAIKATDQLNRAVDELNATTSSYVDSYGNGSPAWAEAVSSNPADLYRHVLQGVANANALPDSRVDVTKLEEWWTFCDTNGFEFNMIRDFQSSVWDTLADIAAAGRASPAQVDGKWSVVVDEEQTVPVQHFTPRNSWGFEAEKAFPDQPDAFRIRFSNRNEDWRQDERIVYADGFTAANAEDFEGLDAPGITDPDHIWKFGRFQIAQAKLRPERWTFQTDFEYIVARRGDLVLLTHDVLLVGLASGRITALDRVQEYDFDFTTAGTLPVDASLTRVTADYDGSYVDSAGVLQDAAAGAARWTYDPATLALRGLLVEPAETNLLLRSEEFDNGAWGTTTLSVTPDDAAAPDGATTADLLTPSGADSQIYQDLTIASDDYVFAVYLKSATGSSVTTKLHLLEFGPLNIIGDVVVAATTSWQRFSVTGSLTTTDIRTAIGAFNTLSTGENLHGWGAQLSTVGGSYIPTTTAAQTRAADVLTLSPPDGTYDIEIVRESGVTNLTGVAVSGGYVVPTSVSPLQSVTMTRTDPGDVQGMTVDETLTMEAGKDYGVSIRTVADAELTKQVVTSAGDQTTVTFSSVIPSTQAPAVGDLFGFGLLGSETIEGLLLGIEPQGELSARLTCIPASPAVYDADTGTIPAFDSKLTALPAVPAVDITAIRSDESILQLGSGNTLVPHIGITVETPDTSLNVSLDVQLRATATDEPFYPANVVSAQGGEYRIGSVEERRSYDVRARWRDPSHLPGAWTTIYNHRVVGQTDAPAALQNATISVFGGNALIRWDRPGELDVRFGGEVRFRHSPIEVVGSATWQSSTSIGTAAKGDALFATLPLKPGTYLARVFDKGGRPSDTVALYTKQASVLLYANVDTVTESPSFTGAKTNVVEDGGSLKLSGTGLFDDIADFDALSDMDGAGGIALSGTYNFAGAFDLTTVQRVRLTSTIDATSVNTLDKIDERLDDIDLWENFDGTEQSAADCRVQVRHTDDDPSGSPVDWSVWNDLDSAEFQARAFQFRARLTTNDPAFNIRVDTLSVVAEDI